MVQKAIGDDYLRYQKTLLVWSETLDKEANFGINTQEELNKKKYEINQKLEVVQRALIEILLVNQDGVSLAQLPNHLKKKLPFNLVLSELGFSKLKDLILSMNDKIKIENRGHNHPFAVLIDPQPYHRPASSTEEFYSYSPHYGGYPVFSPHSSDMGHQKMMMYPNEYDYKYNAPHPVMATNYYPMYPNYQQPELRRDESASSFQSLTEKLNFNKGGSDSFYVPQAASLYGSVGGKGNYPHHLNISHCRNNTGSDIGYDNTLPLAIKHKPVNLSHDFTLSHGKPNKIWLHPNKGGHYDDLLEINSSGFLSEEASMFECRSRSTSPNHCRTVSNLNDPNYPGDNPPYTSKMPRSIGTINEERKSEEEAANTLQEMEDIIAPILTDHHQAPKPHLKNPTSSKLVPTSSIFLPTSKNNQEKDLESFRQNIVSASKLKAKSDNFEK